MKQAAELAQNMDAAVRLEAEQLAAAIEDSAEEDLLRIATHHAAMAGHWGSVVAGNAIPAGVLLAETTGRVQALRWWQIAQTVLLALILWRLW